MMCCIALSFFNFFFSFLLPIFSDLHVISACCISVFYELCVVLVCVLRIVSACCINMFYACCIFCCCIFSKELNHLITGKSKLEEQCESSHHTTCIKHKVFLNKNNFIQHKVHINIKIQRKVGVLGTGLKALHCSPR